ncbi:PucR family transcriptional regulator [Amycolatopsis thailandensis]|uniref:Transcriptional regulator n=1 Tax=Amycolatopsis thailandensis TaxID=589330 RepID=A0A229RP67_9PSEU|nr:PucR family transcriptional regulator [Amycolatopsis thailandensis]OXM48456.1 transcriptional regulator [Amycolatopsis thailandensis]
MVQSAASPWPTLSAEARELFRRGAEIVLHPRAEWIEELHEASLGGGSMRAVAEDPVLTEGTKRANLANLLHWAAANVQHPGKRVTANLNQEVLEGARDMVRRGFDSGGLDAYRRAQGVAWRRWIEICFDLTSDPVLLRELLDVSSLSITTFIEDTVAAVSERMAAERSELTRGAHAERRATVTLLLEGAPIGRSRAEAQLGYPLAGPHTAAIVWSGSATPSSQQLETAAETLMRASDASHRLTVVASAAALWVWLPGRTPPRMDRLAEDLAPHPDVRVALGRPGSGIDGFRRSHLDAAATQRMLARLTSPQQIARYQDIQLLALLTGDPAQAGEFIADTLGDFRHADAETRETVRTYVHELGNTTRTAERLYTHRNTVVRRLARADELLPRPLAENAVDVAVALETLRWLGSGA